MNKNRLLNNLKLAKFGAIHAPNPNPKAIESYVENYDGKKEVQNGP
jgi:hypothetical protein